HQSPPYVCLLLKRFRYHIAFGPKYSTSIESGFWLTVARTTSRRGRFRAVIKEPSGSYDGVSTSPPPSRGSTTTCAPTAGGGLAHFTRIRCVSRLHFRRLP